jgi:IS1 family transposase
MLWLWVLVSARTVLYLIGPRSREMLDNALAATFAGILMSDGYTVYRDRPNRLR